MTKLFPRKHGASRDIEFLNRCRAHRILDQVKAGLFHPKHVIDWALKQTGDAV